MDTRDSSPGRYLIVLSARTAERLHAYAYKYLGFLQRGDREDAGFLRDLAYTLQIGRVAQDYRIAFLAGSMDELVKRFKQFLALADSDTEAVFFKSRNLDGHSRYFATVSNAPADLSNAEETQVSRLIELARNWCNGKNVNWKALYKGERPKRISLPTYPFAETPYWLDCVETPEQAEAAQVERLHPLVHRNESDAFESVFVSRFSESDFFLSDHRVQGSPVLPGVAQLEMARFACGKSLRVATGMCLRDVVWLRPLVMTSTASLEVYTRVMPLDEQSAKFELYRLDESGEEVVHSQGRMAVAGGAAPSIDIGALTAQSEALPLAMADIYEAYARSGISYGPALQGLKALRVGRDAASPMVLAQVALPAVIAATADSYELHPSVLDSALQAAIGFGLKTSSDLSSVPLTLPFALEALRIHASCPSEVWVWIRRSGDAQANGIEKLDISLCDQAGNVCAELSGFTSRLADTAPASSTTETLYYQPRWQPQALSANPQPSFVHHQVVLVSEVESEALAKLLPAQVEISRVHLSANVAADYDVAALHVFEQIRSLIQVKDRSLLQVVIHTSSANASCLIGLSGLLRTARQENPTLFTQCLQVPAAESTEQLAKWLSANARAPQDEAVRYVDAQRQVLSFSEFTASEAGSPWRDRGIYLITGGLGGLGLIVARDIAQRVQNAVLILTGRSALTAEKAEQLTRLNRAGVTAIYEAMDVTDAAAVTGLVNRVVAEHGGLSGVIHSAGVIADNFILKKTPAEFRGVLAPKVIGLVNLDQATQHLALSRFICFSSTSALGNPGQADYAAANAFMDAYMEHRQMLVSRGERQGVSLSINWPLWAEGGMRVHESVLAQMRRAGFEPLTTTDGIEALHRLSRSTEPNVGVMAGDRNKLKRFIESPTHSFESETTSDTLDQATITTEISRGDLLDKTLQYLKKRLATTLKLAPARIEADAALEKYGIDSILALQMVNELEDAFGALPKTLMFEYQSIAALAEYFIDHHRDTLISQLKVGRTAAARASTPVATKVAPPLRLGIKQQREQSSTQALSSLLAEVKHASTLLDIAIIGLSGRYPQAVDLGEYWENLKAGKDCITEIPATRWDHSRYFDPEKGKFGKTNSKWGGFISGVDEFDPLFFGISPNEAVLMDPQERLFLQCAHQAIEDAGYTRDALVNARSSALENSVGVFVGVMYQEYQLYGEQAHSLGQPYALGGNPSSIANRVSYFCNFRGPSLAVDTMCSSSLTAIHLACESMKRGGCEIAVAGGVNVSVHPNKYLMLAQGNFSSSTGRCESFGRGGDGYVPGEGVGAVLLKSLSKAIADGDHIYGVIKGTSVNHGGKTNGFTVPNVAAQAQVIAHALKESRIDPRTISYIEAHGTGTSLGDPIEIAGLTQAFSRYTQDRQYCAIGSAKSNVGHLESAAGIAGVTKVLLQMQHRMLVPSLHSEVLNPHIDFERTPFTVQQDLAEWKRPVIEVDGVQKEYPRIAGISSFGAGGSNAHVIVEEYPAADSPAIAVTPEHPALIVLSARREDRLQEQAKQLLGYVVHHSYSDNDLAGIAYTLQVGREAMDHRLAFTAATLAELKDKLTGYVEGKLEKGEIEECYRGEVKKNKEALSALNADDDASSLVRTWIEKGKYTKLLELWVKGLAFDWTQLYLDRKPRRLSLPTYPFVKERYWVETGRQNNESAARSLATALHPLAQRNTSTLHEQRFSSSLSDGDFFLRDHVVKGMKVLPGVCYLEMARAAVMVSLEQGTDTQPTVALRNVVWLQPLVVAGEQEVHIGLYVQDRGEIEFEIYTGEAGDEVVHAQGCVLLMDTSASEAPVVDLSALRSRCDRTVEVAQCYEAFSATGLEYGAAHRGLTRVQSGTDAQGRRFVLAQVKLPACVSDTADDYVLHPSVLDGALQSTLGLSFLDADIALRPTLPFALEALEVVDRSPAEAWVVVRPSATATPNIQKLDIDICDESGRVCVRLTGFTSRVLAGDLAQERAASKNHGVLLFTPAWQAKPLTTEPSGLEGIYGERWVCVDFIYGQYIDELKARWPSLKWVVLPKAGDEPIVPASAAVFEQIKALLNAKPKRAVLFQLIVGVAGESGPGLMALSGLLKSASLENPKFIGQVIGVSARASLTELSRAIEENVGQAAVARDKEVRYVEGIREVASFRELSTPKQLSHSSTLPWKDSGVYLITGGAGGLGLIVAQEISRQVKDARVFLTGRSSLSEERQAHIASLLGNHTHVEYRVLDVTDAAAVAAFVAAIIAEQGHLHGIAHSAGVIHDNFIIKKSDAEFKTVLAPKVSGTLHLDRATRTIELDFFVLFSSLTGGLGNVGQSDYATANAFLDGYAAYRNQLVKAGERRGRTLSIGWPLWASGGMQVDDPTQAAMRLQGFTAMTTAEGIDALYRAWRSNESQVEVAAGDLAKLKPLLLGTATSSAAPANLAPTSAIPVEDTNVDLTVLLEKVQGALIQLISQQLNVKPDDIDVGMELSEFGFDSVSLTAFGTSLNQRYGFELSPTIFFEYPTVHGFAEYLVNEHTARLREQHVVRAIPKSAALPTIEPQANATISAAAPKRRRGRGELSLIGKAAKSEPAAEPIAIIGMSGCFPGAADVDAFWENLLAGKDSIAEIPSSRWDWQAIYGDPALEPNKTNIKWGGFIEGVDEFDPSFFNISPREAESMDPQQRLLMTYTWRVIEDAGYSAQSLSGSKTAIYVGTASTGYSELVAQAGASIEGHDSTSGVPSIGPNRMSYLLNLHGPSEPIETACSSSLVAIHRAVRAMQNGDCDQALVGGVNTIVTSWAHISFGKAGMLCEDGRCKTFSKDANGYVRGEGVGMLFLKKLSAAQRDGDHIYGLIKGSSENHGGRANSLTAPNPKAQAELIKAAYREAKIDPRTVSYIETHGTGTPLGDPIEINGLKSAFADLYAEGVANESAAQEAYCGLGSVKTNIGHLELAAGIAGVVKVLLQLKHRTLAPSLHCGELNPHIQLADSPFYIVTESRPWQAQRDRHGHELPRRAGISSFGFGGVNAHVIIEEYRAPQEQERLPSEIDSARPALIVLSAKNEQRLQEQARQLSSYLRSRHCSANELSNLAYTLQVGREPMEYRLATTAATSDELQAKLADYLAGKSAIEEFYKGDVRKHKESLAVFNSDATLQQATFIWVEQGQYTKLLDLWVKGLSFDWAQLYGEGAIYGRARRVSLPTYPFAKERYWVKTEVRTGNSVEPAITAVAAKAISVPTVRSAVLDVAVEAPPPKPARISLRSLQGAPVVSERVEEPTVRKVTLEAETTANLLSEKRRDVEMQTGARDASIHLDAMTSNASVAQAERMSQEQLEEELTLSLAAALYMERDAIELDKPFTELGLDSIIGIEWIRSINKDYALTLSATRLYDHPTLRKFAAWLHTKLPVVARPTSESVATVSEVSGVANSVEDDSEREVLAATNLSLEYTLRDEIPDEPVAKHISAPPPRKQATRASDQDAIAIVGMSGRYPGASDLSAYWENLAAGVNSIEEIPGSRWPVNDFYDPTPGKQGKVYCKWLGVLADIEYFDPLFFNIPPAEAPTMDPQQRLFLEEAYKAFQDAGYNSKQLSNRNCGVYLGLMSCEYATLLQQQGMGLSDTTGNSASIAAARVAYHLNLKGPAISIDTACSSSLVATHLACQALRAGEINMALVGGVTLYLTPQSYISMCAAGMLSPDGQCRTFDNGANGFVPGDGVGALVLKRLSDAEAEGDRIYGVIVGSGINQDGKTNGITAPSASSQIELMRDIYQRYDIDPASISYIETHGTGTKLGDVIELEALSTVFREKTSKKNFCAIGSVKSNLGHTSAAAGVAGIHKILLALKHREWVPTLNFVTPNEHFEFEGSPFFVNTQRRSWVAEPGSRRRAAVSAFGYSGTNAHVVIEEYCASSLQKASTENPPALMILSANTEEQLYEQARQLLAHIQQPACVDADLGSIAYTLQTGRDELEYRLASIASKKEQLIKALSGFLDGDRSGNVWLGQVTKTRDSVAMLEEDEDAAALLATWSQKKKLRKLAQLWVRGLAIDWTTLYSSGKPKRASLPAYSFARERYWLNAAASSVLEPASVGLRVAASATAFSEQHSRSIPARGALSRFEGLTLKECARLDLQEIVRELLRRPQGNVDENANLVGLGLDSVLVVQCAKQLAQRYDIRIAPSALFSHPTLAQLAEYLVAEHSSALRKFYESRETLVAVPEVAVKASARPLELELPIADSAGFPLSQGQKGLWVLQQMAPDRSDYNLPLCFPLNEALDLDLLLRACELTQQQYPMLTSVLVGEDEAPLQRLNPSIPVDFHQEDVSAHPRDAILALLNERTKQPFVLQRGPNWRVHVLSRSANEHIVLIVVHHILFDGGSAPLLARTLLESYESLKRGERVSLKPPRAAYRDFVEWERAMLASAEGNAHQAYWKQQLSGALPVLAIPSDRPRTLHRITQGRTHTCNLQGDSVRRIRESSSALGVTPAAWFLGVYNLLLHRYTGEQDIIVGMPTMGRPEPRFDELVGYFVNMIALRSSVQGEQAFAAHLHELQQTLIDGLDHAQYPFPCVVRDLRVPREAGRHPVFQVAYEYQNASLLMLDELRIQFIEGIQQEGEYELVLEVMEQDAGFTLNFKYDSHLFEASTIARMASHYLNVLSQVMEQPRQALASYRLMSAQESRQMLVEWNATEAPYPRDRGIHHLISEQARRTPLSIAASFENRSLTYRQLDETSSQLAVDLNRRGVRSGDRIGLCVERSLDLPVGLLGILKAGAAYVPLDPAYPHERLRHMLQDSGALCVVTQSPLLPLINELVQGAVQTICLDKDIVADVAPPGGDVVSKQGSRGEADKLAYVMYTSGSTGRPKGVMITHGALVNFLMSMSRAPGLAAHDRLLAVTTYSFDISGLELYLPLLVGAQCHICSTAKAKDAELLRQEIARVQPTVMQATPTTWSMLLQIGWCNQERLRILCGGEALPQTLRQRFVAEAWDAWNLYGPTETTIWSTVERILRADGNSIGTPIANTQIYILDAPGQPTPPLVPGELCIAGDGLSTGYFNQPALTAGKFVDNPFEPGTKLYRTGDLAYWRADGTIECVGRIDAQVKLRGYRVELGEIESCLAKHPWIQSSAVAVCEEEGRKYLAACCVLGSDPIDLKSPAAVRALREHLKATLPDYMVPSKFVALGALPLTPNGKVDRKQLPAKVAAAHVAAPEVVEPTAAQASVQRSAIEQRVLNLWRRALAIDGMGVDDGFFDAGGDSVLAVTVAARIKKEFNCEFSVTDMFRFGTVRQITNYLLEKQYGDARIPAVQTAGPSSRTTELKPATPAGDMPGYYRSSVAIIGMSCQFPGAEDHREFWDNLIGGKESIQALSPQTLRSAGVPESVLAQANYVPVQSVIEGKACFDAEFFKISTRDAELMDPQLRLLLQHAWKAVEDAGYIAREIPDTSVLIASSHNDYAARVMASKADDQVLDDSEHYVSWLLAQSGTIPTMISHRLGLKGPSLAVHSNCSSSLVALNAAYRNLLGGESRQALVGAATVFYADKLGYVYQKGMNFSSDGHVKTFDAAADGMIGGEGVAVILLKRAVDAIADGDHIYALIRGIAVNNDGSDKVGFYAPSAEGQTDVIETVLRSSLVEPRSISYVEAHGTGTELGDPIELAAISTAYRRYTDDRQFCGIGSVKTNVGHLDTAAGLAGLIKVALSLEHRVLPPTLNYRTPNPKFALAQSPFYVVDKKTSWQQDAGPRRAALSSFGIGGTNSHAILEEAPQVVASSRADQLYIVPLSARNTERLRAYAQSLSVFLKAARLVDIADMAHTLQLGREAMNNRVAFVVKSTDELISKLDAFQSNAEAEGCFVGTTNPSGKLGNLDADDLRTLVSQWTANGQMAKLAQSWANGFNIDRRSLHSRHASRRISLPTYPFAKRRFWFESQEGLRAGNRNAGQVGAAAVIPILHPLVQANISTLAAQQFKTVLTGDEFFLRDHVINGKRILPGVTYLEMARVAIEQALSTDDEAPARRQIVCLRNVVWPRPLAIEGEPAEIVIRLLPEDANEIGFEISRAHGLDETGAETHCQGKGFLRTADETPRVDLSALRSQSIRQAPAESFYAQLPAIGFTFGPSFKSLQTVYEGVDGEGQSWVLAEIVLQAVVQETAGQYGLHPSLVDAAVGILPDADTDGPTLPFVLQQMDIFERCEPLMAAYVRYAPGSRISDAVQRFDIDLCNSTGLVCVQIRGYSRRELKVDIGEAVRAQILLAVPRWQAKSLTNRAAMPSEVAHSIILVAPRSAEPSLFERHVPRIQQAFAHARVISLVAPTVAIHERFGYYTLEVVREIKRLLGERSTHSLLVQVVVPGGGTDAMLVGLSGLVKSAHQESGRLTMQLLEVAASTSAEDIVHQLRENVGAESAVIRYDSQQRLVERFEEVATDEQSRSTLPWKDRGVYLITGGAGGLGMLMAREIASRATQPTLILVGRSALSEEKENALGSLRVLDAAVEYQIVDVADAPAVERLVGGIIAQYGQIHGVIHAAGLIQDNYLTKKTTAEIERVLAPKVHGVMHLDEATKLLPLDMFLLFSSTSASLGNAGQADYAAANAYLDAFARWRETLRLGGERHGRTLSINWPLWRDGGMQVPEAVNTRMLQIYGMSPLDSDAGIDALYRSLALSANQVMVLSGNVSRIRQKMFTEELDAKRQPAVKEVGESHQTDEGQISEIQAALSQLVCDAVKISIEDFGVDTEWSSLGFNSISFIEISNRLNKEYALELAPTIFFEYPTLHSLCAYLVKEHKDRFAKHMAGSTLPVRRLERIEDEGPVVPRQKRSNRFAVAASTPTAAPAITPEATGATAIVGMSGCFPGARDMDAFWENLDAGKDSITEIPPSRWDWREIYGDPAPDANKTRIKWGGFIEGVDEFDPLFFNISPKEAESMDPQQRLLLTYAWKAIEDAGYSAESLSGSRTAIFVGTGTSGYSESLAQQHNIIEGHSSTSAVPSIGPSRMSYLLNLHGPSEPIETACSSSLVAIHRAVRAMQAGDCDQALVGGINTMITSWAHLSFSKAGMLCEDGRCKTFSKDANGYVRGEGVGMLFLKKLHDAQRDGDHIYGLIKGSAENHGGRANSLTAPNPKAQAELLKAAYREAKIDPRTISYIEAHGTGTPLGDPIEINGLKSAFADLYADHGDSEVREAHCGLGSVKTNIGHLELAAGVAGAIKVLLQLKHKTLVKSLYCEQVNPYIQLSGSPFYLVNERRPWVAIKDHAGRELPRRAGVSSFGFGGVNAHVIIEEYRAPDTSSIAATPERPALIVLSAKREDRLREQAKQLLEHMARHAYTDADLADIAYTLQVGRDAMEHRLAFIAATLADLKNKLSDYLEGKTGIEECYRGEVKKNKDALVAINSNESLAQAATWREQGQYGKFLELWARGLVFDWTQLYLGDKPRRLALPTYPFAKERYWIEERRSARSEPTTQASTSSLDPARWLRLTEQWAALPLITKEREWSAIAQAKGAQRVLILYRRSADVEGLKRALAQTWAENANRLLVDAVKLPELSVENAAGPLDEYLQKHRAPDVVFYFSGAIENASHIGAELRCVLQVSQALINRAHHQAIQFHYCYPASEAVPALYQEGLSGLFRAIAMECPAHCYRGIEYPRAASLPDYVSMVREWLQPLTPNLAPAQLPMVRYRDGVRYATALTELAAPEFIEKPVQFRRGATYLMVGALGEVGQIVCRALARMYRPRLIILSRRSLDADVQQRLAAITDAGAEVLYRSVDITDELQLATMLRAIKNEVGTIQGVFHFARAVSDGLLLSKNFASFQQTIAAKVEGVLAIDKVTADQPLDFFMVYSSSAAFGIAGSADYGYATAFQNAFVRYRNRLVERGERTGRSLALCWGQWEADIYSTSQRTAMIKQQGFDVIDAASALPLMEAALQERSEIVGIIAVVDKQNVKQLYGLCEPGSPPVAAAKADDKLKYASLEKYLTSGGLKGSGGRNAVRQVLLERSYAELAQLYEALTD